MKDNNKNNINSQKNIQNKKNENQGEEEKNDVKKNNLETFQKENESLQSIKNIQELMSNKLKYKKILLSHNELTEIKEFFGFKNVSYLDLSHNYFQKLDVFTGMPNLETLLLNNNSIEHIDTKLKNLKKLSVLDLSYNKIDVNDKITFMALKYNTLLESISFKGNKNYDFQNVKIFCLEYIKKIVYLDDTKIFNEVKRSKSQRKPFISVKGNRGNIGKIGLLKDYIQFKLNDINDYNKENEEAKEDLNSSILKKVINKKGKEKNTSNYYFTYLSSV